MAGKQFDSGRVKRDSYWETMGKRTPDFWAGVREGIRAYGVWKDGTQLIGIMEKPIQQLFFELGGVIEKLGLVEVTPEQREALGKVLDYAIHLSGGEPYDEQEDMDVQIDAVLITLGLKQETEE